MGAVEKWGRIINVNICQHLQNDVIIFNNNLLEIPVIWCCLENNQSNMIFFKRGSLFKKSLFYLFFWRLGFHFHWLLPSLKKCKGKAKFSPFLRDYFFYRWSKKFPGLGALGWDAKLPKVQLLVGVPLVALGTQARPFPVVSLWGKAGRGGGRIEKQGRH